MPETRLASTDPIAEGRPVPTGARPARRLWLPSSWSGNYRLPTILGERLTSALAGFKNRDAAYALFVFLARHHAAPRTIERGSKTGFYISRTQLALSSKIALTENEIRGAIAKLLRIGAIETLIPVDALREPGRVYKQRQLYRFCGEYLELLCRFARRGRKAVDDRVVIFSSKSPKNPKGREATLHVGELGRCGAGAATQAVAASPSSSVPMVKIASPRPPASDETVFSRVTSELERGCGGKTALYWQALGLVTPEIEARVVAVERKTPGKGLGLLRLLVLEAELRTGVRPS